MLSRFPEQMLRQCGNVFFSFVDWYIRIGTRPVFPLGQFFQVCTSQARGGSQGLVPRTPGWKLQLNPPPSPFLWRARHRGYPNILPTFWKLDRIPFTSNDEQVPLSKPDVLWMSRICTEPPDDEKGKERRKVILLLLLWRSELGQTINEMAAGDVSSPPAEKDA